MNEDTSSVQRVHAPYWPQPKAVLALTTQTSFPFVSPVPLLSLQFFRQRPNATLAQGAPLPPAMRGTGEHEQACSLPLLRRQHYTQYAALRAHIEHLQEAWGQVSSIAERGGGGGEEISEPPLLKAIADRWQLIA